MGPTNLVPREGVEIDFQCLDVHLPMRRECYPIHAKHRTLNLVDFIGYRFDTMYCAQDIARMCARHQFGLL